MNKLLTFASIFLATFSLSVDATQIYICQFKGVVESAPTISGKYYFFNLLFASKIENSLFWISEIKISYFELRENK